MSVQLLKPLLRLPAPALGLVYVGLHLVLDWATFVPAFSPLGITPWNPTTGLGFGLALVKGPAYASLLAVGQLTSEVVFRGQAVNLPVSIAIVEVIVAGLCYAIASAVLLARRPAFDPALDSVRDLLLLGAVATVAAAVVALLYVGVLAAAGLLAAADVASSALRYWIGETIGIMVITPFLLRVFTGGQRMEITREGLLQTAAILAAIGIVLGLGSRYQTQLFYVLFLPVVWVAVRQGLAGVAAALVLMQVGIMISLHLGRQDFVDVTEFQAVMLVLVGAGLTIGILVQERRVSEARLRLLQDAMARGVRLASVDRFSAAMAHEINQPLTAIANYVRAARRALDREPADQDLAREAAGKALEQVSRAAEVVRRLRNLITRGEIELLPCKLAPIVAEAVDLVRPDLAKEQVRIEIAVPPGCPDVRVDVLQIQQVLTNLARNAMEAMREVPADRRRLVMEAVPGAELVTVHVCDTGPGFPPGFRVDADLPSPSTKPGGLGVGLALSAAIVEAHGGTLVTSASGEPGRVSFTLKIASGDRHGARN